MSKSAVRIFRKHILGPGRTEHSGRGFWMMYTDASPTEVRRRAEHWVAKNPDKVEHFDPCNADGVLELRLVPGYGDRCDWYIDGEDRWFYRTLRVVQNRGRRAYASVSM